MKKEVIDGHGVVLSQEELRLLGSKAGKRTVELPDPTPMAPPVGFTRRPPLHLQIREMVQRELSLAAAHHGYESAEEADDFDVGDDFDPESPYEHNFEPPAFVPTPAEQVAKLEKELAEARAKAGGGGAQPPSGEPTGGATAPPPEPKA